MKVDLYTKCVLTVIAGCLLWLCLGGREFSLQAQTQYAANGAVQRVELVTVSREIRENGVPIRNASNLPLPRFAIGEISQTPIGTSANKLPWQAIPVIEQR